MSGIAGIIHFDGAPVELGLIEKMTSAMSHRGPDGIQHWQQGSVALGQCMLHTTSESLEEVQPWFSEDGRYVLVMDGRLDNWEELRRNFELRGCRLRNRSDVELVMQAFQLWGVDSLEKIEGDFAFVIWDACANKLACIRDRMGSKPFHYYWDGKTFAFASEVSALLALPMIPRVCNESMMIDYFMAQWCTKDETLWKGISRLPQAHRIQITPDSFVLTQYWEPDLSTRLILKDDNEYAECYQALFIEAVRRCSRSHMNVAFEVSGGLDSSALFAVADRLDKSSKLPAPGIDAYTLGFPDDDDDANELNYVRSLGAHLNRKVHEIEPSQPSISWLRAWAKKHGEFPPYPNASMLVGMRNTANTRGSRVIVAGVGGDEWLMSGRGYYAEEILSMRWRSLFQCWHSDQQDFGTVQSAWWLFRHGLAPLLPEKLKSAIRARFMEKHPFGKAEYSWLTPEMKVLLNQRRRQPHAERKSPFTQIGQLSKWNMLFSPTNALAREAEDRMAAMSGLELRWPFFNLQLAQFAFASPDRIRLRGRTNKFVHRKAMSGYLPEDILNRRTKADFMITYRQYLRGMVSEFCREIPQRRPGWVKADELANLYKLTQRGATPDGMPEWQLWGVFGCDAVCV